MADSNMLDEKKEARRKKSLGELGELFAIKTLVDLEFDRIRNVNDDSMNEKFADILCEKNGLRYVISVKARNMYQIDGSLNSRYNLGSKALEHAEYAAKKYSAVPYWMAIQFDSRNYSVFFGALETLNGSSGIPIRRCQSGEVGSVLVNCRRHYFDFETYKNTRPRKPPVGIDQ